MLFSVLIAWSLVILVHEAAHWVAARMAGVLVEQVGVFVDGFGRHLLRVRVAGTAWVLGWLPVGGYTRIAGIDVPPGSSVAESTPGLFAGRTLLQRLTILLCAPAVSVLFSIGAAWLANATSSTAFWATCAVLSAYVSFSSLLPIGRSDGGRALTQWCRHWYLTRAEQRVLAFVLMAGLLAAAWCAWPVVRALVHLSYFRACAGDQFAADAH